MRDTARPAPLFKNFELLYSNFLNLFQVFKLLEFPCSNFLNFAPGCKPPFWISNRRKNGTPFKTPWWYIYKYYSVFGIRARSGHDFSPSLTHCKPAPAFFCIPFSEYVLSIFTPFLPLSYSVFGIRMHSVFGIREICFLPGGFGFRISSSAFPFLQSGVSVRASCTFLGQSCHLADSL